jgi:hypothetical protein
MACRIAERRTGPVSNEGLGPSRWLSVHSHGVGGAIESARGRFAWSDDATLALRFARREDAWSFAVAMRALQADLPVRCAIVGLRDGDRGTYVAEHMWMRGPNTGSDNG